MEISFFFHKTQSLAFSFWRLRSNFLSCVVCLAMKGVDVNLVVCRACHTSVEFIDHAIFRCHAPMAVWNSVVLWCNIDNLFIWNSDDLLSQETLEKSSALGRKKWVAVLCITAWCI